MWTGRSAARLMVGMGVLWAAVPGFGQATPASVPDAPAPAKCPGATSGTTSTEQKPCPAPASVGQQFPYPGETPETSAKPEAPVPAGGGAATPSVPSAPTPPGGTAPAAGQQFPYPGEDPGSASSSSGSSSGSSSSSSSGAADPGSAPADGNNSPLKDAGSEGENTRRRKLPKVTKLQSDEDRELEDLDVAKYYLSAGSPMAAYLRSKDAVKLKPNDVEAHFSLAQAAAKLKKHDEAMAEYQLCLQMEPDGDRVKAVRKQMAELK